MEITEVSHLDFPFNLNIKSTTVLASSYKKTSQLTQYTKFISVKTDYSDLEYFTLAWMKISFNHLCSTVIRNIPEYSFMKESLPSKCAFLVQ